MWKYHLSWLWLSVYEVVKGTRFSCEQIYFDADRCLQDAEVLLKLAEEVNGTLRNKVGNLIF